MQEMIGKVKGQRAANVDAKPSLIKSSTFLLSSPASFFLHSFILCSVPCPVHGKIRSRLGRGNMGFKAKLSIDLVVRNSVMRGLILRTRA